MTPPPDPDPAAGAGPDAAPLVLHASCVAGRAGAVLIRGASRSGKSTLALNLLALGAELVADDRTALSRKQDRLLAAPPAPIAGLVEARGLGLVRLPHRAPVPVIAVVDLDSGPVARLPHPMSCDILGLALPLLLGRGVPHLSSVLRLLLDGAELADPDET